MLLGSIGEIEEKDLATDDQLKAIRKQLQMQQYMLIGLIILMLMKK